MASGARLTVNDWRQLRLIHDFLVKRFHHFALVVGFVQALRHGELHLTKLATLLDSLPKTQDSASFSFLILVTFVAGCVWPWCFAQLRKHLTSAVKDLDLIALILNTVLLAFAAAMAKARPSDWSLWIIALGFGVCVIDGLVKGILVLKSKGFLSSTNPSGLQTLGTIDPPFEPRKRAQGMTLCADAKAKGGWLGPYGE